MCEGFWGIKKNETSSSTCHIILGGMKLPVHDTVLACTREDDDGVNPLSLENSDLVHHQRDGGPGYQNLLLQLIL